MIQCLIVEYNNIGCISLLIFMSCKFMLCIFTSYSLVHQFHVLVISYRGVLMVHQFYLHLTSDEKYSLVSHR